MAKDMEQIFWRQLDDASFSLIGKLQSGKEMGFTIKRDKDVATVTHVTQDGVVAKDKGFEEGAIKQLKTEADAIAKDSDRTSPANPKLDEHHEGNVEFFSAGWLHSFPPLTVVPSSILKASEPIFEWTYHSYKSDKGNAFSAIDFRQ